MDDCLYAQLDFIMLDSWNDAWCFIIIWEKTWFSYSDHLMWQVSKCLPATLNYMSYCLSFYYQFEALRDSKFLITPSS